jgi:hypothetical protein
LQVVNTKFVHKCWSKCFEAKIGFNMPSHWRFRNTELRGSFPEWLLRWPQERCCNIGTFFMTFG